MKFFEMEGYEVVLLCPKKLSQNWVRYQRGQKSVFESDKFLYTVRYHTDLQANRIENYDDGYTLKDYFQHNRKILFVIDESHNLRNDKSNRYNFLVNNLLSEENSHNKDLKVLLLSATPINTQLLDIRNQFKLMVRGEDNGFAQPLDIPSLQAVFIQAQKEFNLWSKANRPVSEFIQNVPQKFFYLTDTLVVARTRQMIQNLPQKEGEKKLPTFPKKEKPVNCYHLPQGFGEIKTAEELIKILESLHLWAYQPAKYTKSMEEWKKEGVLKNEAQRQGFLARMMFFLLVKRLESSWHSFYETVQKILAHHENALTKITAFIKNQELNPNKQTVFDFETDLGLDEEDRAEIEQALKTPQNEGASEPQFNADIEAYTLGKNQIALKDMTRIKKFEKDVKNEITKLKKLADNLKIYSTNLQAGKQKDEKLTELIKQIKAKRKKTNNPKVIIFTAFKDTAVYLHNELMKHLPNEGIAFVAGDEAKDNQHTYKTFETILERFAPRTKLYNEKDWINDYLKAQGKDHNSLKQTEKESIKKGVSFEQWKNFVAKNDQETHTKIMNPIDILIATDCISEGQNLQDADCVVNYDIHWNPVRLIQRLGRIDRLGSINKSVWGINFWIGESYENAIKLKGRVEKRMAIMALSGTETIADLTEEMETLLKDNPLLSEQEAKMMAQMQTDWNDIETGAQNLSLADMSLEFFRQELLQYLMENKGELENMPYGVFSGFKIPQQSAPYLTALIQEKQTNQKILLCTDKDGTPILHNHYTILKLLSDYKKSPRALPTAIDAGKPEALKETADMLKVWIDKQAGRSLEQEIDDIFGGKSTKKETKHKTKEERLLEDKFKPENFDLLLWEVIS